MTNYRYVDPDEASRDPFAAEENGKSEFESLLENEKQWASTKRYKVGEQVEGVVLSVGQDFAFIDLGGKNTGALSIDEARQNGGILPKVGEKITLYVREDNGSEVLLTRSLRRSETDDVLLREAYEKEMPIEAKIEKVIKGGFEANVGARRAFVPLGGMELAPISNPESYIGSVFKFNITEFSKGGRNIVLSRRSLLREEQEERTRAMVNEIEPGQLKRATITRLATFGAFADIGGIEGLIPISELAWARVKSVEDVVKPGDVVNVKVLRVEHSPKLRIALSVKSAGEDPWVSNATQLMPGTELDGLIARMQDFGAFVSLNDGIEGLLPVSQITWERRLKHPSEILKVGQSVKVQVLSSDVAEHKLTLTMKGQMPAEMATRLKARMSARDTLSPEDQELQREWKTYQDAVKNHQVQQGKQEDRSIFAAAFAKARKRH